MGKAGRDELGVETEVKVKIEDVDDFCRQLEKLNPEILSARHFEDNFLLDFPDEKLASGRCLLRIRFAGGQRILTFKGPPHSNGIFKTREELETPIESGETLLQIFEKLGMLVTFRYQKFRREFTLETVHVAVDETPIGNYAEFEGSEEGIRFLASRMGFPESSFIRLSYYSLHLEYCGKMGREPDFMIF